MAKRTAGIKAALEQPKLGPLFDKIDKLAAEAKSAIRTANLPHGYNSEEIEELIRNINHFRVGKTTYITIPVSLADRILEVLGQAKHTEEGHESGRGF